MLQVGFLDFFVCRIVKTPCSYFVDINVTLVFPLASVFQQLKNNHMRIHDVILENMSYTEVYSTETTKCGNVIRQTTGLSLSLFLSLIHNACNVQMNKPMVRSTIQIRGKLAYIIFLGWSHLIMEIIQF